MSWLTYILEFIFPARPDANVVSASSDDALLTHLRPSLIAATDPVTTALLPFSNPLVAAAIRELKYHDSAKALFLLGNVLDTYFVDAFSDAFNRIVLIPIPLSPQRLRERGYNQCERVAAYALSRTTHTRLTLDTNLLSRVRDTEHQARLSYDKRQQDLSDTFMTKPLESDTLYIVLDDVVTTGATMRGAIDALKRAGATGIFPLSLAFA